MLLKNQDQLHVGIFQMNLEWESPKENLLKIKNGLEKFGDRLNLLILPEMFTTGFSMEANALAWTYSHPEFIMVSEWAKTYKCSIIGSVWFYENDKFYNRCFHWSLDGEVEFYDKVHTFSLVKENKFITGGTDQKIFHVRNWKIKPQICYDLRFPKGSYNIGNDPYDLLLYVANWPEKRIEAWDVLLKARAVENQSYVIGVNRVGEEPKAIKYSGHSVAIDYKGKITKELPKYKEEIMLVTLQKKPQIEFRNRFPFIMDEI